MACSQLHSRCVKMKRASPSPNNAGSKPGNSGTLSNINASTYSETGCLGFQTTANTIVGIKLYSGTACRDITQKFAVTSLTVAEA